jgi:hypothetical protein
MSGSSSPEPKLGRNLERSVSLRDATLPFFYRALGDFDAVPVPYANRACSFTRASLACSYAMVVFFFVRTRFA